MRVGGGGWEGYGGGVGGGGGGWEGGDGGMGGDGREGEGRRVGVGLRRHFSFFWGGLDWD